MCHSNEREDAVAWCRRKMEEAAQRADYRDWENYQYLAEYWERVLRPSEK